MLNEKSHAASRENRMRSTFFGALGGTRTPDLLIRSQTLYPAELQTHLAHLSLRVLKYNNTPREKMQEGFEKN